jgi:thiosulfate/3-mercaptopyruvate sulfurtransferase
MKTIRNFLLTGFALLLVSTTVWAQGDIISAADFMKLYKTDKSLVVIDASKATDFKKSHIKNAINVPNGDLNTDADHGFLKSDADLAKVFGDKGVGNEATIVVYDGGSQKPASRVYWVLKYLGAPNVKILHKDMASFKKSRVPLTPMAAKKKATTFTVHVNHAIAAGADDVKSGNAKLFDARDANEFAGTTEKSKGHIPGAINLSYKEVQDANHAYKSKAELEKVVAKYGLNANTPIIVSCQSGKRAAVLYVAFTSVLGYKNVKMYDGSYNDWVAKGNKVDQ